MAAAPIMHSFDMRDGRIVSIRFTMDDGTERVVGARVEVVDVEPEGEWIAEAAFE